MIGVTIQSCTFPCIHKETAVIYTYLFIYMWHTWCVTVNCKYNQPLLKKSEYSELWLFIQFCTVGIFYVNMATSEGEGVFISLLGTKSVSEHCASLKKKHDLFLNNWLKKMLKFIFGWQIFFYAKNCLKRMLNKLGHFWEGWGGSAYPYFGQDHIYIHFIYMYIYIWLHCIQFVSYCYVSNDNSEFFPYSLYFPLFLIPFVFLYTWQNQA